MSTKKNKRTFRFLRNFLSGSCAGAKLTVAQVKWTLLVVFIATVVGIIPAFCGASIVVSVCFAFPFWVFSGYRILSVRRYIYIAAAGEIEDAFRAIGPEKNETIWDSQTAANYRKVAVYTWLLQTVIFLTAPLYFNFTDGGRSWLLILIMVLAAITMVSIKASLRIFRGAAVIIITLFIVMSVLQLFPHVAVWSGLSKFSERSVPIETIKKLQELHNIKKKQKDAINNAVLDAIKKWQLENPGEDLPPEFQEAIEAASRGLTRSQYKKEKEVKVEKIKNLNEPPVPELQDRFQRSAFSKHDDAEKWFGMYHINQKPGWVSVPVTEPGKYEICGYGSEEDLQNLMARSDGNEIFIGIRNIIEVKNSLELKCEREGGKTIKITVIKRVG